MLTMRFTPGSIYGMDRNAVTTKQIDFIQALCRRQGLSMPALTNQGSGEQDNR